MIIRKLLLAWLLIGIVLMVAAIAHGQTLYEIVEQDGTRRVKDRATYLAEVERIRQDVQAGIKSGRVQPAVTAGARANSRAPIPTHHAAFASGGVVVPNGGFAERSQLFVAGAVQDLSGPARRFAEHVGAQLPASDRARWWIVLYVDQAVDPESEELVRDFGNHKGLKTLAGWAKLFVIDKGASPAANARHAAALAEKHRGKLPAILVCSNPEDPVFGVNSPQGWKYAFQGSGYGGDAEWLARNLYQAIREQYLERGVSQCPGPYCPNEPDRQPDPYPGPNPSPYRPNNPRQPAPFQPVEPPPRMDDPQLPVVPKLPKLFEQITWTHVFGAVVIFLAFYIANRKGWLNPGEKKANVTEGGKDAK